MIKLIDYIKDCLNDEEFRIAWEKENSDLDAYIFESHSGLKSTRTLTMREALNLLNEIGASELDSIITNKGIKAKVTASITTEIIFYEDKNGCPVKDFLTHIDNKKLKAKTLRNILELAVEGNSAKPPLSVYVDDGIFELRTQQSSNIDRIFYFFIFGNKIVLTNGYIKKSQKLDKQEFERAKRYRDDYMKKFKGDEQKSQFL